MSTRRFQPGTSIVVREVLHRRPWLEFPEVVVSDDDVLATVQHVGTPLTFHEHPVPHPWRHLEAWTDTTTLKLRRPGDWYSVWKMFVGREWLFWYVNFEEPYRRTDTGIEINDLQLDLKAFPDGSWQWKDVEHLAPALASGRITQEQLNAVLAEAAVVAGLLEDGDRWWSRWAGWTPDE